jgi:hypothetical protein
MGHGKSLGSFDGPPIFLYVHGWATKQKPMSTSKNKDINNKTKQNYPNYQMLITMLLNQYFIYTTTRSGRITANWRAAQYQLRWNYVCQYSAVYIYTMFIAASFFYYKSVFSQFRLCGS